MLLGSPRKYSKELLNFIFVFKDYKGSVLSQGSKRSKLPLASKNLHAFSLIQNRLAAPLKTTSKLALQP